MSDVLQTLIRKAYEQLDGQREKIERDIKELREACPHPLVLKAHKSNTGNYDPSSDSYWTEFRCPDCQKFWSEEGSL